MSKQIEIDITVPNQTRYLAVIGKIAESLAHSLGKYSGDKAELAYQLNLVLTEATSNAMCHANEGDPNKKVKVSISVADDLLKICVFDQGAGFDINTLAKTKVKGTAEGGRGVPIIFKLMDHVDYVKSGAGYVLKMTKHLH